MAVLVKIKTNATLEQIEEAIRSYNTDIKELDDNQFGIYAASYDDYHLSVDNFLDVLYVNLQYEEDNIKVEVLEGVLV